MQRIFSSSSSLHSVKDLTNVHFYSSDFKVSPVCIYTMLRIILLIHHNCYPLSPGNKYSVYHTLSPDRRKWWVLRTAASHHTFISRKSSLEDITWKTPFLAFFLVGRVRAEDLSCISLPRLAINSVPKQISWQKHYFCTAKTIFISVVEMFNLCLFKRENGKEGMVMNGKSHNPEKKQLSAKFWQTVTEKLVFAFLQTPNFHSDVFRWFEVGCTIWPQISQIGGSQIKAPRGSVFKKYVYSSFVVKMKTDLGSCGLFWFILDMG